MDDKILEIKNLDVVYKTDLEEVYAVNNLSFSLNRGETIGIVGETGAGKTTTALSILRLLPERTGQIRTGEIIFDGEDLTKTLEADMQKIRGERISMIFQDPMTSLNPVHTIGDQIYEALTLHQQDRSKSELNARVDEVLKMVGIPPSRKNEYPHQFSGGMKQRVVIAMALSCEPELLIADEPTTALDVTIQAQVILMIRELRDRLGTSMIMITHDLGIVAQTCDNVGIMYAGEIIEYGRTKDVFSGEKHHPYTIGLFNSIPKLNVQEDRLNPIPGLMPDPTDLPEGCKFSPRCPHVMPICLEEHPEDYIDGVHRIACHLYAKQVVIEGGQS